MTIKVLKPIVLVGMLGTGKSTVGKKLARKLHMKFYDSDQVIEEREGLSIVEIVDYRTEDYLRQQEEKIISEIIRYGPVVLSTGGGSFIHENVRNIIKDKAISIWLYTDLDIIHERVSRRNTRPDLHHGDKREILEQMVKERYPIYEQANLKVESGNSDTHHIVDTILFKLKEFLG